MMKGTDYTTFGNNVRSVTPVRRQPISRPNGYSQKITGLQNKLDLEIEKNYRLSSELEKRKANKKETVVYFLNEKERELGELVRNGTTDVSSEGIFLYLGAMPKTRSKKSKMLTGNVVEIKQFEESYIDISRNAGLVLETYSENDRQFDSYIGEPFVKGMTDTKTGRSMMIVGDYTHHGQAGQGYFVIGEKPYNFDDEIGFGDVVLWNNIGGLEDGFIGIDYQHKSKQRLGGARSLREVVRVCRSLIDQGFSQEKEVYLLRTPHLREATIGKYLRNQGTLTLADFCVPGASRVNHKDLAEYVLELESKQNENDRLAIGGN